MSAGFGKFWYTQWNITMDDYIMKGMSFKFSENLMRLTKAKLVRCMELELHPVTAVSINKILLYLH